MHLKSLFFFFFISILSFFAEHVYCTETRPYNQGARLTSYELVHDKLPATLILDSMVAALFKTRKIAAVVVGADRVVRVRGYQIIYLFISKLSRSWFFQVEWWYC